MVKLGYPENFIVLGCLEVPCGGGWLEVGGGGGRCWWAVVVGGVGGWWWWVVVVVDNSQFQTWFWLK